jgi:hypothetical protein
LGFEIGQQIPVTGLGRARLPKPATFCVREVGLAESILADQARTVQDLLDFVKPTRNRAIAPFLCYLPRQCDDEPKPVLDVSHFGFTHQPLYWFSVNLRRQFREKEEEFRPSGGDFQGIGIYRSDGFLFGFCGRR